MATATKRGKYVTGTKAKQSPPPQPVSPSSMIVREETLTPDECLHILDASPNFRPVQQSRVDTIARAIKAGRYALNGETVIFDAEGRLIDGQHRLWACVEAGIPIKILAVRNPPSTESIDTGASRTGADYLRAAGHKSVSTLASIARACLAYDSGCRGPHLWAFKASPFELNDYVGSHQGIIESTLRARTCQPTGVNTTAMGLVHFIGQRLLSVAHVDRFVELVAECNTPAGHPVTALRSFSAREHAQAAKRNVPVIAWNRWVKGKALDRLTGATRDGRTAWEDFAPPPYVGGLLD